MLDLTELKRSNAFLQSVVENITSALFIVDNDIRIQNFNDPFKTLFYKDEDQIIGKLCGNVIGCEHVVFEGKDCGSTEHCQECKLRSALLSVFTQKIPSYRKKLVRSFQIHDEMVLKYFLYSAKHIDYQGKEMVLVILDDITRIEEQKTRLADLNLDFLAILNKLREGVVLVEEDGNISFISHTAVHLLGKEEKSLLKNHWTKLLPFDGNDVAKITALLSQPSETGERLTTNIVTDENRRFCIDIEVKNDPGIQKGRYSSSTTCRKFINYGARWMINPATREWSA